VTDAAGIYRQATADGAPISFTAGVHCITLDVNTKPTEGGLMTSFKDNLLKKIEINTLADRVIDSLGPPESGRKVDRDAMQRLLVIGGYSHRRERDMDLYLKDPGNPEGPILFLDNDLTVYATTVADAVMRKNPLIKEMVSIPKIIKILNDKDVVISKKEDTVRRVQQECLATLDLTFTEADIAAITREGIAAMHSSYADGVVETLNLFAELIGYRPPPAVFAVRHCHIRGSLQEKTGGELVYGPVAAYSLVHNTLKVIFDPVSSFDKDAMQGYHKIAGGDEKAALEGDDAFYFLKKAVLARRQPPVSVDG
jgi:hypothetical protein